MRKDKKIRSLIGYTRKDWDMQYAIIWWVHYNPEKVKHIDTPQIFDKVFESKNVKKKDFVKVKITIEEK